MFTQVIQGAGPVVTELAAEAFLLVAPFHMAVEGRARDKGLVAVRALVGPDVEMGIHVLGEACTPHGGVGTHVAREDTLVVFHHLTMLGVKVTCQENNGISESVQAKDSVCFMHSGQETLPLVVSVVNSCWTLLR